MLPKAQGLYDPQQERSACGIGVVASIKGECTIEQIFLCDNY